MAVRIHLFPSRTQKLSSPVSTILGWRRPGKIERRRHILLYSSIAQSVERMTVNHDVTGSSPVGGATSGQEVSCPDSLFVVGNMGCLGAKNVGGRDITQIQVNAP